MDSQCANAVTGRKSHVKANYNTAEEESNCLATSSSITQNHESICEKDFQYKDHDDVCSNEIHFIHLSQLNCTNEHQNIENIDPLLISQLTISSQNLKLNQSNSSNSSIQNCDISCNNIYSPHNTMMNPNSCIFESVAMSQLTCDSTTDGILHKKDPLKITQEIPSQYSGSKSLCKTPIGPKDFNVSCNDIHLVHSLNSQYDPNDIKTKNEVFKILDNDSNSLNFQSIFEMSVKENCIGSCVKHSQTLGETVKNESYKNHLEEYSKINVSNLTLNENNKLPSKTCFNENGIAEFKKFISTYSNNIVEESEHTNTIISNEYKFEDDLFEQENIHCAETNEELWWVRKSVNQTIDPEFEEFVNIDPHYRIMPNPAISNKPKNLIHLFKFSPMYLLIGDINDIKISKNSADNSTDKWFELFNHLFYMVMLYGRIVETKKCSRNILYTVDDGTGSVKVKFNHNSKSIKLNLKQINELEYDLEKAKLKGLPNMLQDSQKGLLAEKYIAKMEKLVLLIRQRMNRCSREMQVGSRVHVIGHPYFNEKSKAWTINAINLEIDETNGPAELFWKKFIVFMYKEVFYKQDAN